MMLDTSAVIAIVLQEPRAGLLIANMRMAAQVKIGTATLAECGVVLVTRKKAQWRVLLDEFFRTHEVTEVDFASRHWPVAGVAYARFGKGSGHGARLNFGDCLSYAMSRVEDEPLLYVGNDFGKTDLKVIRLDSGEAE